MVEIRKLLQNSVFVSIFQFQSHQIFHVFVVAAAFVHLHGISQIANYRLSFGGGDHCSENEMR